MTVLPPMQNWIGPESDPLQFRWLHRFQPIAKVPPRDGAKESRQCVEGGFKHPNTLEDIRAPLWLLLVMEFNSDDDRNSRNARDRLLSVNSRSCI